MQRVVLEKFDFVPFTGIGFVIVSYPETGTCPSGFRFCFPTMLEGWYTEIDLPEKYNFLEPQAKFEISFGRRKWTETYYYMNFLFKKEYETFYDKWRRRFIPERYLHFLEKYDEVEASVCVITVLNPKEKSDKGTYRLMHDFYENFYAFSVDEEENIFVISRREGEQSVLDYIDEAVKLEIYKLLRKRKRYKTHPISTTIFNLFAKPYKRVKVLHLNEEYKKIYEEELSKIKQLFDLN